jgi:nitrogen fixation protein FixH
MNWGHKIALVYIAFALFMIFLVVMAFRQNFDLVADDYYAQELAYQGRIDQVNNAKAKGYMVAAEQDAEKLTLRFPVPATNVKVHIFRPSDEGMDLHLSSITEVTVLTVPRKDLTAGKYLAKIEWQAEGETYYEEKVIVVD